MSVVTLLAGLALLSRGGEAGIRFHPSVGEIRSLALSGDTLAVGSRGGLLFYSAKSPNPIPLGWGGLIEGRAPTDVWRSGDTWFAASAESVAQFQGGRLVPTPARPRTPTPVGLSDRKFSVPDRPSWPREPFLDPPAKSRGTHVSAVCGNEEGIVAAWFGDGLWKHDAERWSRVFGAPDARHVVALAQSGSDLAFATQEGSVWWRRAGKWTRMANPAGPRGSLYGLGRFRGRMFAASFETGLQIFDGAKWRQARTPTISTDHPRDVVEFQRSLYVRHSTGIVDRFDGRRWTKNVFSKLPRREVSCLGLGSRSLLAGQYGGWSAFDGVRWAHTFNRWELSGAIVTALGERNGETWIGTQRNGVFRYSDRTGAIAVFDQRHDLTDDWIRVLLLDSEGVATGTFIGGAFAWENGRFRRLTPEVQGEASGIVRSPNGALFVGTREGLWNVAEGQARRVPIGGVERLEVQALFATPDALWIAMPFGVAVAPWAEL